MLSICKLWEFFFTLVNWLLLNHATALVSVSGQLGISCPCCLQHGKIFISWQCCWNWFTYNNDQWTWNCGMGWDVFSLSMPCVSVFFLTKLERERREKVVLSTFKLLPQTLSFCLFLNPLHPNVSMHILHTVLYKFPWVLTRRICSTILSFFWWQFPLFSRPLWVIWECYCKEK